MAWGVKKQWSAILTKPIEKEQKEELPNDVTRESETSTETPVPGQAFVAPTKLTEAKREGISCVVLDSGAIIGGAKVERLGDVEYFTIPEVIEELKDDRSRHLLQSFPYPIKTHWVDPECFAVVRHFANLTGDLISLSTVDLKVLALSYQLEKKLNGIDHIRTAPVVTPKMATRNVSSRALTSVSLSRFEVKNPLVVGDLLLLSADQFAAKHPESQKISISEEKKEEKKEETETKKEEKEETKESEPNELDDDSSDGEWITMENLHDQDHSFGAADDAAMDDNKPKGCVCITRDFAMQNVLLQMGLGLLSVNGVAVKTVVAWSLKCYACTEPVSDLWRQFCPSCGGNTLSRISTTVDAKGNVRVREHNRKRFNKRGTQFALKAAKGGRKCKDTVWREDTAYDVEFRNYHREKTGKKESLFDRGVMFGMEATGQGLNDQQRKPALSFGAASGKPTIGMGFRNPNASRRMASDKNRRRNRRRR